MLEYCKGKNGARGGLLFCSSDSERRLRLSFRTAYLRAHIATTTFSSATADIKGLLHGPDGAVYSTCLAPSTVYRSSFP